METERKWVVVRIDGKIAAISDDYKALARISTRLSESPSPKKKTANLEFKEIKATVEDFESIWDMKNSLKWEDLLLFGSEFQKKVWKKLWELSHPGIYEKSSEDRECQELCDSNDAGHPVEAGPRLMSYSDFAELCNNKAGVRAVAHAIGLNPVAVVIPCHLVVPKESIDRINQIREKAESTIFKGEDLCMDSILKDTAIDFGEYALGKDLKRELILKELA